MGKLLCNDDKLVWNDRSSNGRKMKKYHLRRKDKALTDEAEIEHLLCSAPYITLAMCSEGAPYLAVFNHGYDAQHRRIYFHCAREGRKIDVLSANPRVCGIAFEDLGYLHGMCDHAYRSVMFEGTVRFIEELNEKRAALELMIRQQEREPEKVITQKLNPDSIRNVTVGVVEIEEISGKEAVAD